MTPRSPGNYRRVAIAVVVIAVIIGSGIDFTIARLVTSASPASGPERSGPISTYPAAWATVCGKPPAGNASTNNEIPSQLPSMGPPTGINLTEVYSTIITSSNFTTVLNGRGWVTTYWGLQDDAGPGYFYEYVIGQFVALMHDQPNGSLQANYNLQTGAVTIDDGGLGSSCPLYDD